MHMFKKTIEISSFLLVKTYNNKNNSILWIFGPYGQIQLKLPIKNISCKIYVVNSKTFLIFKYFPKKINVSVVKTINILIKNLILGIHRGFYIKLAIKGIGYKILNSNNNLQIFLGYSHPLTMSLPKNCKLLSSKNFLFLWTQNLQELLLISKILHFLKKIDVYKGKGLIPDNIKIILKEGKKVK